VLKPINSESEVTIDISQLESGIYLLSVLDRDGKIIGQNRKISKTNG
jgi:hypothetical protein